LKQVIPFSKFYGATRRKAETPAFAFSEVEDLDQIEVPLHTHENAHFLVVRKVNMKQWSKIKSNAFLPRRCFIIRQGQLTATINIRQAKDDP
jgi:hypothetical protein